jgi:hypothetical protein
MALVVASYKRDIRRKMMRKKCMNKQVRTRYLDLRIPRIIPINTIFGALLGTGESVSKLIKVVPLGFSSKRHPLDQLAEILYHLLHQSNIRTCYILVQPQR